MGLDVCDVVFKLRYTMNKRDGGKTCYGRIYTINEPGQDTLMISRHVSYDSG